MSSLIDREVTFNNTVFTIKEIRTVGENLQLVYLSCPEFNTVVNLNILRIDDKFADEIFKEELLLEEPKKEV